MKYLMYALILLLLMSPGLSKAKGNAGSALNNCVLIGEYAETAQRLRQQHSSFTLEIAWELNKGEYPPAKVDVLNITAVQVFSFPRNTDPILISDRIVAACIRSANKTYKE